MTRTRLSSLAIGLCLAAPVHAAPTGAAFPTKGTTPAKRKRPKGLSQNHGGPPKKNHGVYIGHGGSIDTGHELDDFLHTDHTITGWWMPHFPTGRSGPLFSNTGSGTYFIGQLNYRSGNGGAQKKGNPAFLVQLGDVQARYLLSDADYAEGKWVHIAVTRKRGTFTLYVNGSKQTPIRMDNGVVKFGSAVKVGTHYNGRPQGNLQLGRGSAHDAWQAYGLLDDVGIFGRALSQDEVIAMVSRRRLTGTEKGLRRAWTFDEFTKRGVLTDRLDGAWPRHGAVYHVPLTAKRRSKQDRVQLENQIFVGETHVPVQLPFKKDEIWTVTQGVDSSTGTHNGNAAFCWDFVLAEGKQDTKYPKGTELAPVYSGADGRLRSYSKEGTVGEREPYAMSVELGGGHVMYYLHLDDEHFTAKADGAGPHPKANWKLFAEGDKPTIKQGEFLGRLGPKAEHLHFCFSDDLGTMPGAFVDYQMSEDQGATWTKVYRGIPKYGQWIKRIR
jgi:hypothetical protein